MSTRKYWIGFNHVAGIGPQRMRKLLAHFSSLEAAWHASASELRQAGLDRRAIENLQAARTDLDLMQLQNTVAQQGASVLTLDDMDYPPLLRELPDSPPVLYARGTLTRADNWAIAIVGTRKASAYGRDTAYNLAQELALAGLTIVSGLALGIDAAAHRGALDAGGRTIAVLPNGIGEIYPPEHRNLAKAITAQGALLTEFPPGMKAVRHNFAPRNRIISGLSLGVVVVEAPLKSGALMTTDSAAEQGREVFAVPGQTTSAVSKGANRLIQDGAKLVMSASDVLEELNMTRDTVQTQQVVQQIAPENALEKQIVGLLADAPLHVDELCRTLQLPVAEVSSTLTLMELKGLVRQIGAMQYALSTGNNAPITLH